MKKRTGDEDVGGAVLAVVDEEVGLWALRQRVLARVCVGRPLRHPPARSLSCSGGRRTGTASGAWRVTPPTDGLSSTAVQAQAIE